MTDKIDFPSMDEFNAAEFKDGTLRDDGTRIFGWDIRKPQKATPRRMIRVNVVPGNGYSVAGYQCTAGTNWLIVYENEVPTVRKLVATQADRDRLAMCSETVETQLLDLQRELKLKTRDDAIAKAPVSLNKYAEFWRTTRRGYPPIDSMDEGPEVVAPDTIETLTTKSSENTAKAFADALRILMPHLAAGGKGKQAGA